MSKIYVPTYDSTNCATWINSDTLRVYSVPPIINSPTSYIDYYVNSHYLSNNGIISFSSSDAIPSCIVDDNITTDFYYRNDLSDILIIFIIIVLFCFYFPFKIISRFFGRWLKI